MESSLNSINTVNSVNSVSSVNSVNSVNSVKTRSSWLNCALRDDEAKYCVSIGHYEAVAVCY